MNGAQLLIRTLEAEGTKFVFGYPGGAIMPVYDALVDTEIRHILARHEQGAILAADGFARATGDVGVCLATSGPGAANLVTGIANAAMDSVPLVAIVGQVPTALMGTDAFQEIDTTGMTLSMVKHSYLIRDVHRISETVRQAFAIARSGRPGPVVIDLPKDVMLAQTVDRLAESVSMDSAPTPSHETLDRARALIEDSKRPVIYAGGGIGLGRFVEIFRGFVERLGLPVVTTLKGIGALATDHPQCLGMLGMHGSRQANLAVQESDLLLCIGARFDDRATGRLDSFAPEAKVIHFDVDASEIGKLRKPQLSIVGNIGLALSALTETTSYPGDWSEQWLRRCRSRTDRTPRTADILDGRSLIQSLFRQLPTASFVSCDVGQHQMWVAQHGRFSRPEHHLSSGGLGTMGYGLPAAIGAQLAFPSSTVVNVSGDGSIMMNLQELATLRRYALPVKIVLVDNQALGLVRQWQSLFFERRYSEVDLSDNPDFVSLARAFGLEADSVSGLKDLDEAIATLLSSSGPAMLHVRVPQSAGVWPLVPPNAANNEMLHETAR